MNFTKSKAKRTDRPFSVKTLARRGVWDSDGRYPNFPEGRMYFDHCEFYRRGRNAAAIVCHLYYVPDDIHTVAAQNGLFANVDPVPSWYSDNCTVVIYTPIKPE